jgi:hypothetical protein
MNTSVAAWRKLFLRWLPLAVTIGLALLNGSELSPLFDAASFYLYGFAKGLPFVNAQAFSYLTSCAVAVLTLLLAGIPPALYERLRGLADSTPFSLALWLLATLLLTLPTLSRLLGEEP